MGLAGATGVGVSAIVGGGLLALAGVAFAEAGPSAILAFALNGVIAFITVLTFAEMSTRFPESGGTYTFAKKVLSVEAAFGAGWVVWFASIVAAVLYGLGSAAFATVAISNVWDALAGDAPGWITGRWSVLTLALGATAVFTLGLSRKPAGGGGWINIAKLIVFTILLGGGLAALTRRSPHEISDALTPFFSGGGMGVLKAMGFTFIALQGFDLIAAVAGEVRDPKRTLPRAMFLSLGAALAIYLPLLFLVATVGVDIGGSITELSSDRPETVVAVAAQNYLGHFGYWLVMAAAILSMLSALQANLFAASRVSFTMAVDRTLPRRLGTVNVKSGTPISAVVVSALAIAVIMAVVGNVAAAGAVASLIFLISFALAHWTSVLARRRSGDRDDGAFRVPFFPLVPVLGIASCLSLAVFQGGAVPAAGIIAVVWLAIGGILYLILFARHARVADASMEALDPDLVRMRGRNPLVLVPVANPAHAESMIAVANALTPPKVGRVLLLSVVAPPSLEEIGDPESASDSLAEAQKVLHEAMKASFARNLYPEALTTVSPQPWPEIVRVARAHNCACLLVGLSRDENVEGTPLERLIGAVDTDVVVLRAPPGWKVAGVKRVLVPVGGRSRHDALRARLLGSLVRMEGREVTFLQILPGSTTKRELEASKYQLFQFAHDEARGHTEAIVVASDDVAGEITQRAAECDLVILGLQRVSRRHKFFGDVAMSIARNTECALIMISRRG